MMNDEKGIFELVVYVLATWRVASLFVQEGGPGSLFRWLRERAGITHDEQGNKAIIPDGFWAGVLSCVWCASIWIGAGWVVLDWFFPVLALRLVLVFALSAGAVLVDRLGFKR